MVTMKFDDIIEEIGEFGPYQKRIYFLVSLVAIPCAVQTLVGVFILAVPEHRCALPGLDNDTYKSQGQWHDDLVNMSIPWDDEENAYSQCKLYMKGPGSNLYTNETMSCSKWVYNKDPFQSTFITEDDMVCDDISLRTYANMVMMGGIFAGALIMGPLSDLIGRKKVLIISVAGEFSVCLATAFVRTYIPFTVLRFFTSVFGSGMFLTAFVIGMEIVGPKYRKIAGIVIEMFWVVGLFIENGIAYGLREWNHLQIAISAPIILLMIYIFAIPESPRWLINRGKNEEAINVLQAAAKGNGVVLSDKILKMENIELDADGVKIWHMFTTPRLVVRSLVIFFNWLVASMVYYGLSLNVGNLSGDIYLNFFLSALVELASYVFCIFLLDVIGRKALQCLSMLIGGVACICTLFPVIYGGSDVEWVTVTLSLIGKFGASAAFAVIYIFSAELFPTVVRNAGMGLSSMSARIGGVMAPYIADIGNLISGDIAVALPLLIFGGMSIAAGLLALLLPETANRKLPETVEDAKYFGRKQWSKNSYALDMPSSDEKPDGKTKATFKMNSKF